MRYYLGKLLPTRGALCSALSKAFARLALRADGPPPWPVATTCLSYILHPQRVSSSERPCVPASRATSRDAEMATFRSHPSPGEAWGLVSASEGSPVCSARAHTGSEGPSVHNAMPI